MPSQCTVLAGSIVKHVTSPMQYLIPDYDLFYIQEKRADIF